MGENVVKSETPAELFSSAGRAASIYRGCVLAAAAAGSSPGLQPSAACPPPPHPVSCRTISCSINQAMKAKNIYIKKKSGTLKLETFCGGVLTVLT